MHDQVKKPQPKQSAVGQHYWDGLKQETLLVQKCTNCGKVRHYPRIVCDSCYSMEHDWIPVAGTGKIHSWTVCHHAFHPGFASDLPYTLLTVDLNDGVRALGRLRNGDPEKVSVGLAVRVGYSSTEDGWVLPVFDLED